MTTPDTSDLRAALRGAGHRVTRPRRAVWSVLREAEGHLKVDELARRVEAREPGVNVASVYRALAVLDDLGMVRESRLGDEEASRWEVAHPDEHFHLVCDSCGTIDHHVGTLVEQVRDHLADGHDFLPRDIELIVTGTCGDCAD